MLSVFGKIKREMKIAETYIKSYYMMIQWATGLFEECIRRIKNFFPT